jgi:cellobiose-specific phosphotransferase system component IIC
MDIEQLKLILDLMQKAGEGGSDLFIFYMLLKTVPGIFGGGLMIGLLYFLGIHGFRLIRANMAGERLRSAAGVSVYWKEKQIQAATACLKAHYKDFADKDYNLFD